MQILFDNVMAQVSCVAPWDCPVPSPLAIRRMSAWTTLPTEIHIVLGFAYPKQR